MKQILKTNWKKLSREERGRIIFKNFKIIKTPYGWRVPSQTQDSKSYLVKFREHKPYCNCPDCQMRRKKCKHIWAVEFYIKKEISQEGIKTTKGIKIIYRQEWKAYNKSQTTEKIVFMQLLRHLCNHIEQPLYKFGRPTLPLDVLVFGSVMKTYSTFSLRRFMSEMTIAKAMGLINKIPCFASIGHFLQKKSTTKLLKKLIKISSLPLASVETDFTVDSSGFSTSRFARYYDYKYNRESKYRVWFKAHLISGVKTNIITGVEITDGRGADSPQLKSLLKQTSKEFTMIEVSCDRAYCSKENFKLINKRGAIPFIPFKSNITGKRPKYEIWRRMYHYFMYKHEEFLEHYHKRSNAETVFHMIKTKFKDNLRSKTKTAQVNELLCKVLCHNICVVIQEMNELGLRGEFIVESERSVDGSSYDASTQ